MSLHYPAFSSFRELMTLWDEAIGEMDKEDRVRSLLDGQNFILFFKKDNGFFGAPEESRLTFARIKDEEENMEDARFMAVNLIDALAGKMTQNLFNSDDIKKIKIIDKEDCGKHLLKHVTGKPIVVRQQKDDGFVKMGEDE